MIAISSGFESGSIDVLDLSCAADLRVALRTDSAADVRQWFHFRLSGARGERCTIRFANAAAATYAGGWPGYSVRASYDRSRWFQVPTEYDGRTLAVHLQPEYDAIWLAYFEPYPLERHQRLLGVAQASGLAIVERLGASVEGRDLDMLRIGEAGPARMPVWIIGRQHPGETMAAWCAEGLLTRLLDRSDPVAKACRERAVFHVVPNMNPDGVAHGNLRTNAAGTDLNRQWQSPDPARSPEVMHVRDRMIETGVSVFIDIHGDEALPHVFLDAPEHLPGFDDAAAARLDRFRRTLRVASPDFQTVHGYPRPSPAHVNLGIASRWAGHRFGALAATLELPFKDNAEAPEPATGWNGERSMRLGEALLVALLADLERPGHPGRAG
jgi:murein tripeptide amidase MpaA